MAFLSRITMKGFKTFARPTELVFEQGVSVIIGPNGSGKSNIADAVLWALGEQSPTSIRGRSMQDVIFSGSDGQKPSAVAEVSLVFDNSSGVFPLEFQEVVVTRRVTRDGSSEYRINGALSRLLDVEDLVAGVGLGREMHSVISQGKVDEIVNSTPGARRALVEEAAGLGRYKKRRDRALAKLEKAKANLLRVSDVEREVRSALRPLKQQVSAAERFAEATEELARLRALSALHALAELEGRISRDREALEEVRARRRDAEDLLAGLREERLREEERFSTALREREALSAVYHKAAADLDRIRARGTSLEQRVHRVESDLARARRRTALAEEEWTASEDRLASLLAGPSTSAARLRVVSDAAERLAERLDVVRPELAAVAGQEEGLKDEVFALETERARTLQERENLQREIESRARRADELDERARLAGARLGDIERTAAEKSAAVRAIETHVTRLEEEERSAVERAETARREADAARDEARAAEAALAAVSSRTGVLRDLAARREGTPQAARHLLESATGSALVVESLKVRAGYERAVSAAFGSVASGVVLSGRADPALLRADEGPIEVVWPESSPSGGDAEAARVASEAPARDDSDGPGVDLWEVVEGPDTLIEVLRKIVPPARLVDSLELPPPPSSGRLITLHGEVWHGDAHAARRGEAAAEAILSVRAELEALKTEEVRLAEASETAAAKAESHAALVARMEADAAASGVRVREARAERAALLDEVGLWGRRLEEAVAETAEVEEQLSRDAESSRELERGLVVVAERLETISENLEASRAGLRAVKDRSESLRSELAVLEGKRSQAAVLGVRLRERERARGEEQERARAQAQRASRVLEAARERESGIERFLPALAELHTVTPPLAAALEEGLERLGGRLARSRATTDDFGDALKDQGRRESELQRESSGLNEELVRVEVSLAHLEEQASERERELEELRRRHLSPRSLDASSVVDVDPDGISAAIERAERKRERIGPVNPLAEQEYKETRERADFLAEQRKDLEASLTELRTVIRDLEEHIETTFTEVFESTRAHFEEMVKILFPGGRGMLRLTDDEPIAATLEGLEAEGAAEGDADLDDEERPAVPAPGLILEIKPPRKAPKNMSLLSGGEKALAAIAFLFGLFLARPCPFYVLDEVEAALDDLNLSRFLSLVRRYQQRTQFIVITHQRRTMEIADRLYGVAMDADGTSRVLSRRLGQAGSTVAQG